MLIGHEEPWATWRAALAGQRMHHAWLLAGKAGLGKSTFSLAAAHELVGGGPPPDQHPDILRLTYGPKAKEDERKQDEGKPFELARSLRVGQIRELQRRLVTRPTLGDRRAIIVDPADDLEMSAANALLKSLEEPPAGTFFLLVCHNPSRLLPTIRSRCRLLRFPTVDAKAMADLLRDRMPDADAAERAAAIEAAAGSPGAAMGFVAMGLARMAELGRRIRDTGDPSFTLRGELAGMIGAKIDRERTRSVLALARAIVAEGVGDLAPEAASRRIVAHEGLVRLTSEFATYNFDQGLLATAIGNLLAGCAAASERADA